jgi:hypothetical protein
VRERGGRGGVAVTVDARPVLSIACQETCDCVRPQELSAVLGVEVSRVAAGGDFSLLVTGGGVLSLATNSQKSSM